MKLDAFLLLKEIDSPFLLPVVCLVRSFYLYFFFQLTDLAHSHVECSHVQMLFGYRKHPHHFAS